MIRRVCKRQCLLNPALQVQDVGLSITETIRAVNAATEMLRSSDTNYRGADGCHPREPEAQIGVCAKGPQV
jgi:hypothetical protein